MKTILLSCPLLLALLLTSNFAQPADKPYSPPRFADPNRVEKLRSAFPELDRLFREFATAEHVPGVAYGVVIDGNLVHTGVTGFRDLSSQSLVDADTVFRIASMTKSFTALAILKLRDEGKLSLDDLAERYIPELKSLSYPTSDSPKITIRQLLNHAEGFPEDNPWGDRQLAVTDRQFAEMLRRGIPFSNSPGIAYEYSNFGFAILGRIVSRVSGMRYADYVSANILRPLRMTATTFEPKSVPANRLAHGYRWEGDQWKEELLLSDGAFGAMGGLLTSLPDLARYVSFLMSAWPPRNEADTGPVRRAAVREMQQAWRTRPALITRNPITSSNERNPSAYGFGLGITQTCDFAHVVSHSGGLPGFGSQMRWLPEYGVGIIAFGNRTYTRWNGVIDQAFESLKRTGGLIPRLPQPSPALVAMRAAVSQLIVKWDDQLAGKIAAENLYLDLSKERRRREIEEHHAKVGTCRPEENFEVENALRGKWIMNCERGKLEVAITLAPTNPPLVQMLAIRPLTAADLVIKNVCGQ